MTRTEKYNVIYPDFKKVSRFSLKEAQERYQRRKERERSERIRALSKQAKAKKSRQEPKAPIDELSLKDQIERMKGGFK